MAVTNEFGFNHSVFSTGGGNSNIYRQKNDGGYSNSFIKVTGHLIGLNRPGLIADHNYSNYTPNRTSYPHFSSHDFPLETNLTRKAGFLRYHDAFYPYFKSVVGNDSNQVMRGIPSYSRYDFEVNTVASGNNKKLYFKAHTIPEKFDGAGGNDTLYGGDGNDTLIGGMGDDILVGQTGADSLVGGMDDDIIIPGPRKHGVEYIDSGDGNDVILLGYTSTDEVTSSSSKSFWNDHTSSFISSGAKDSIKDGAKNGVKKVAKQFVDSVFGGAFLGSLGGFIGNLAGAPLANIFTNKNEANDIVESYNIEANNFVIIQHFDPRYDILNVPIKTYETLIINDTDHDATKSLGFIEFKVEKTGVTQSGKSTIARLYLGQDFIDALGENVPQSEIESILQSMKQDFFSIKKENGEFTTQKVIPRNELEDSPFDNPEFQNAVEDNTKLFIYGAFSGKIKFFSSAEESSIAVGTQFTDYISVHSEYFDPTKELFGQDVPEDFVLSNEEAKFWGFEGNDILVGGEGQDTLYGGEGDDELHGISAPVSTTGPGTDVLHGEAGDDILYGGTGADKLFGGKDKDTLFGGIGNDTLYGGTGDDTLTGGTGQDQFVFRHKTSGVDFITDFSQAEGDTIKIYKSGFDDITTTEGFSTRHAGIHPHSAIILSFNDGTETFDIAILENVNSYNVATDLVLV